MFVSTLKHPIIQMCDMVQETLVNEENICLPNGALLCGSVCCPHARKRVLHLYLTAREQCATPCCSPFPGWHS